MQRKDEVVEESESIATCRCSTPCDGLETSLCLMFRVRTTRIDSISVLRAQCDHQRIKKSLSNDRFDPLSGTEGH